MNETENQKENFRQRCAVLQDENASEGFTVPMEETATKKRGNKKTRIALVIALSLVLLAVIALGGVSVGYHFGYSQKNTAYWIGGALFLVTGVDVLIRLFV